MRSRNGTVFQAKVDLMSSEAAGGLVEAQPSEDGKPTKRVALIGCTLRQLWAWKVLVGCLGSGARVAGARGGFGAQGRAWQVQCIAGWVLRPRGRGGAWRRGGGGAGDKQPASPSPQPAAGAGWGVGPALV
jgi:hypothetical protein